MNKEKEAVRATNAKQKCGDCGKFFPATKIAPSTACYDCDDVLRAEMGVEPNKRCNHCDLVFPEKERIYYEGGTYFCEPCHTEVQKLEKEMRYHEREDYFDMMQKHYLKQERTSPYKYNKYGYDKDGNSCETPPNGHCCWGSYDEAMGEELASSLIIDHE